MDQRRQESSAFGGVALATSTLCSVIAAIAFTGCSVSVPGASAADCPFEADRSASVAVGDATQVKISAAPGQLVVRGQDGLAEVGVRGKACATVQEQLDGIQVVAERRGDEILIKSTVQGASSSRFSWLSGSWSNGPAIDLEIDVPKSLTLDVSHGVGSMDLRGIGPVSISDGSGDVEVEDVSGDASISDGSGNVVVQGLQGNLEVKDGSGDLMVGDIEGEVEIKDGSGDVSVDRVSQWVTVSDGSGKIEIENIGAGVSIRDTSGDIEIRHVDRDVEIEVDSSGDISVSDVGGDFTVVKKSGGEVQHSGVAGKTSIPNGRS